MWAGQALERDREWFSGIDPVAHSILHGKPPPSSGPHASATPLVKDDDDDDGQTLDDALPEGADVEQVQSVGQNAHDQRPDQRPDDAALAAERVGPADD